MSKDSYPNNPKNSNAVYDWELEEPIEDEQLAQVIPFDRNFRITDLHDVEESGQIQDYEWDNDPGYLSTDSGEHHDDLPYTYESHNKLSLRVKAGIGAVALGGLYMTTDGFKNVAYNVAHLDELLSMAWPF